MQPYRDSEDLPQKPVIAAGARGASRGEGVAGRIGAGAERPSACIWAQRLLVCACARCESRHGLGVWLLGLDWGLCQQCLC